MLYRFFNEREFKVLDGKTITKIEGLYVGSKSIEFYCSDGTAYRMYHQQDGDEDVCVTDLYAINLMGGVITNPDQIQRALTGAQVFTIEPSVYQNVYEQVVSDIPQDWALQNGDRVVVAKQVVLYELRSVNESVIFKWTGIAHDDETFTGVDIIQIAGEGTWLEIDDRVEV